MNISNINLPRITTEFYNELCKVFYKIDIRPDTDVNTIMYVAGQQKVLEYIGRIAAANLREPTTEVTLPLPEDHKPTGTWDRIFGPRTGRWK